jgi:hypothetical protein
MVRHASQGPSYQRLDDESDENLFDLPGDADGSDRPPLTVRAAVKRAPTPSRSSHARMTQVAAPTEDVREVRAIPEGEWERWLAQTRRCLLFPCGPRKTSWDIAMLCLILYSCVTVPFRIGMGAEAEGAVLGFEILVSFAFCTDLVLNFYTACAPPRPPPRACRRARARRRAAAPPRPRRHARATRRRRDSASRAATSTATPSSSTTSSSSSTT